MSIEQNKALYRRWLNELWGDANLAVADEIMAHDFVDRMPEPGFPADRAGHKAVVATLHGAFPDWHFTAEREVAEGDQVAGFWRMEGTNAGPLPIGIPPTGKRVTMTGLMIMRIADGRIAETWHLADLPGLLHQLGVMPMPAPASA
jgi:predicted ester cyclase